MKRSLCLSTISLLMLQGMLLSQNYTTGDTLNVVAQSGLRLRSSPSSNAGTIRILEFGESVQVQNTFGFDSAYYDQSGWLPGNWIYVNAEHVSGFVFDVYLSTLDLPSHEDELCLESLSFSVPIQQYVTNHYPLLSDEQGLEHREDIDQCITYHADGITMTQTMGRGWYKTDVVFNQYRLSEVINLLRSMLVGNEMRELFEESLKFYRNKEGRIYKINVGFEGYPVSIKEHENGAIEVSMTDLTNG